MEELQVVYNNEKGTITVAHKNKKGKKEVVIIKYSDLIEILKKLVILIPKT